MEISRSDHLQILCGCFQMVFRKVHRCKVSEIDGDMHVTACAIYAFGPSPEARPLLGLKFWD